jgi:hypothetical protein
MLANGETRESVSEATGEAGNTEITERTARLAVDVCMGCQQKDTEWAQARLRLIELAKLFRSWCDQARPVDAVFTESGAA